MTDKTQHQIAYQQNDRDNQEQNHPCADRISHDPCRQSITTLTYSAKVTNSLPVASRSRAMLYPMVTFCMGCIPESAIMMWVASAIRAAASDTSPDLQQQQQQEQQEQQQQACWSRMCNQECSTVTAMMQYEVGWVGTGRPSTTYASVRSVH